MYRIGQLAKLANVTTDTIRFYEKNGMLSQARRDTNSYRLYNTDDLQKLRFIRYAKQLGFTLEAIAELLSIRVEPANHSCEESKAIVQARLQEVENKLDELKKMQVSLQRLNAACCGQAHSAHCCSILEAIEQGANG